MLIMSCKKCGGFPKCLDRPPWIRSCCDASALKKENLHSKELDRRSIQAFFRKWSPQGRKMRA